MDRRAKYRYDHDNRKLETWADMVGMTIYRDKYSRITHLSYKDYTYGDPVDVWEKRGAVDPDEERLPDKSCDRYCMDYWRLVGGPHRYSAASYKTQKDLDEIAERIAKALNREGRAQLKAEATEAERQKRRRESERRDSERRKYNERVAWERRVARKEEQARIKAAERMRQRPNYGPPQRPTPAEQAAERTRDETIARRMRQKEAMDAGKEFSITQDGRTIIVTWDDRRITDERLVRLVLSAEGWGAPSRKMTEEEEQDYWYWKARGR